MSPNVYFKNLEEGVQEVKYKNLKGLLPKEYPSDLMSYTPDDIYNIAMNTTTKKVYKVKHINGKTLTKIIKDVYKKYPSFDTFDAKGYQKIFPKLSINELNQNAEDVLDYAEKMMAFDIASAFSQLKGVEYTIKDWYDHSSSRMMPANDSFGDILQTVCAAKTFAAHPRIDFNGVQTSIDEANTISIAYGAKLENNGDALWGKKQNGFRHGIWGVYIGKFGTWRYSDSGKARGIIADLLYCHEVRESGLDTEIDVHNNKIALNYYSSHVVQTGSWPNRNTRIHETVEQIGQDIEAYPMTRVFSSSDISSAGSNTIVHE